MRKLLLSGTSSCFYPTNLRVVAIIGWFSSSQLPPLRVSVEGREGYVVLPGVFSPREVEEAREGLHQTLLKYGVVSESSMERRGNRTPGE